MPQLGSACDRAGAGSQLVLTFARKGTREGMHADTYERRGRDPQSACNHLRASGRPSRSLLRRVLLPLDRATADERTELLVGLAVAAGTARVLPPHGSAVDSWVSRAREVGQGLAAADPAAQVAFGRVIQLAAAHGLEEWLRDLNECATESMFVLTELYSEFIESRQRAATGRAHRLQDKIEGRELRLATQYFTPGDLGHALVSQTVDAAIGSSSPSRLALLVDPACGTGNLLLVGLHELTHRWQSLGLEPSDAVAAASQRIRGYDLDRTVARICRLALETEARVLGGAGFGAGFQITWGEEDDSLGFLRTDVPLASEIEVAEGRVALVTNPPFLGRRLMSRHVKAFLSRQFPLAGNELCAAFVQRTIEALGTDDAAGFVSQTAWMHLSSYESLRTELLESAGIYWFCEIGTGAFDRLSGEKARVALITLVKGATDLRGHVLDLDRELRTRSEALWNPKAFRKPAPSPDVIRTFPGVRFVMGIDERLANAFAQFPRYGDFATPMQGTSTGANDVFVRLWWTSDAWSEDWALASKGGAHARWAGHDHHLVRWGVDGDGLTADGAALRNATKIDLAQIVYSDTGSGGLNARHRREGQIFIAGGPGIVVGTGVADSHLAFLNSRLASALIQTLSPKLVTTPGVLGELPCPADIVDDQVLAALGRRAWKAKEQRVRETMPAPTWIVEPQSVEGFTQAACALFVRDVETELESLAAEDRIDSRIAEYFEIEPTELTGLTRERRPPGFDLSSVGALDRRIASMLGPSRVFKGDRAGRGYSAGGVVDSLVRATGASATTVAETLVESWKGLEATRLLYLEDVLHSVVLGQVWRAGGVLPVSELLSLMSDEARCLPFELGSWLRQRLPERQTMIFPRLEVTADAIKAPNPPKPVRLAYGY